MLQAFYRGKPLVTHFHTRFLALIATIYIFLQLFVTSQKLYFSSFFVLCVKIFFFWGRKREIQRCLDCRQEEVDLTFYSNLLFLHFSQWEKRWGTMAKKTVGKHQYFFFWEVLFFSFDAGGEKGCTFPKSFFFAAKKKLSQKLLRNLLFQ